MLEKQEKTHSRNLISQIKLINEKYDEIKKINGENFNIFSILKIEKDEVKTHSYFIYNLLNPQGTHDQGELFLDLFLKKILKKEDNHARGSVKYVKREELTNTKRRVDFIIEAENLLIAIEMKIEAADQSQQLYEYYKDIKKKKENIKLFYLTLDGKDASNESRSGLEKDKDYQLLSFSYHIYTWLEECIEKSATIPSIREGLVQYRNLIQKLTNQTTKKIGEEMENILKTQKDIEAANTIIQEYPKIWAKKEVEFWTSLKEKLEKSNWIIEYITYEHDHSGTIDYELVAEYRQKKDDWFGLSLEKESSHNIKFNLNLCKWNTGDNILLEIYITKGVDELELTKLDSIIKEEIGFINNLGDKYRHRKLKENIKFYGKNVAEPTFELFDPERFQYFVQSTAKEVKDYLSKIETREEELLKALSNN